METYTKSICVFKYIYIYVNIYIHIDINTSCCSVTKSCLTLGDPMDCSMPSFSALHCLPEFAQIHVHESVMLSNHLILCHPFTFCLQSFPESGSFPMSHFFASGGQSPGASASSSVLPMTIQGWFSSELTWSFVSSTKPFLSPLCSPPS